jgi:hypothetical protein
MWRYWRHYIIYNLSLVVMLLKRIATQQCQILLPKAGIPPQKPPFPPAFLSGQGWLHLRPADNLARVGANAPFLTIEQLISIYILC